MPSARRPVISFDAVDQAHQVVQAVQDRIAYQLQIERIVASSRNPRQRIDNIAELADSLRDHGLLQPVVVRRHPDGFELIAGHRRFQAAKLLGWTEIAAVVRDETDDQAYILTLVENLQRENLTPREEAAALEVLVRERGWSTRQVGEAVKRSAMYVSRRLRVFDDPVLAPLVLGDHLPVSTAEELLREPDADTRRVLADQAVVECWTQPVARREVAASRNVTLQATSSRLGSRIRALAAELSGIDPDTLSGRTRRDLARLVAVAERIAH
jgi:ParB/RepB/Spo0J family partition protein